MIRGKKGFTLIELIIVVIITGILAAVAVPMFSNMRARAIATEAVMGVSAMRQAIKNYSVGYARTIGITLGDTPPFYDPPDMAASINPSDFDGTYFSRECYSGLKLVLETPVRIICLRGMCNFDKNTSTRSDEVNSLKDDPNLDAFINIDKNGKITQYNFSRSGYPEV